MIGLKKRDIKKALKAAAHARCHAEEPEGVMMIKGSDS